MTFPREKKVEINFNNNKAFIAKAIKMKASSQQHVTLTSIFLRKMIQFKILDKL